MIGVQSVVKTMHLLVGNLTAAVFGNHLQTAIQRLVTLNPRMLPWECSSRSSSEQSKLVSGSGTDMGGAY